MKKKILFLLIVGLILVGCEKNNKKDWIIDIQDDKQVISEEEKEIFTSAIKNYSEKLDYVALLARQVVAGTNYMFLCQNENEYKIAIVYQNLENLSQITQVNAFNPLDYVNENFLHDDEVLSGGWTVTIEDTLRPLSNPIKDYFDKATETLTGASYYPIASLAHQEKDGMRYAILCYGEGSYKGSTASIYMITLSLDEKDNSKIESIANIDLAKYNK